MVKHEELKNGGCYFYIDVSGIIQMLEYVGPSGAAKERDSIMEGEK